MLSNVVKGFNVKPSGSGVYVVNRNGQLGVTIIYANGFKCDYPIKYDTGVIAYNYPEVHSATTKKFVEKAFKFIEATKRAMLGGNNKWPVN